MELRKLREAGGFTKAQVAHATGMSPSKISREERAQTGIYLDDLHKLLDFYRVNDQHRMQLLDLARHTHDRGWLRINSGGIQLPEIGKR